MHWDSRASINISQEYQNEFVTSQLQFFFLFFIPNFEFTRKYKSHPFISFFQNSAQNFKEAEYEQNVITLAAKLCEKKLKRNASEISKSFLNTWTHPTQKYEKQISKLKTQIKASKTGGFFKQMMEDSF